MSRVGKKPVDLPNGVQVTIEDGKIEVKGPKGTLSRELHPLVKVEQQDGKVVISPIDESLKAPGPVGTVPFVDRQHGAGGERRLYQGAGDQRCRL